MVRRNPPPTPISLRVQLGMQGHILKQRTTPRPDAFYNQGCANSCGISFGSVTNKRANQYPGSGLSYTVFPPAWPQSLLSMRFAAFRRGGRAEYDTEPPLRTPKRPAPTRES